MRAVAYGVLLTFLALVMAGCSSEGQADDAVTFETLSKGSWNGITNQRLEVINNGVELNAFWFDLMNGVDPAVAVPTVDFDSNIVIGVVAPEGTFELDITRIERINRRMIVYATVDICTSICVAVVLRPYHVVRVAKDPSTVLVDFVFSEELI